MALINCKECGFKISDKAAICVHCGAPLAASAPAAAPPKKKPKSNLVPLIGGVVIVAVAIFAWMSLFPEQFDSLIGRTPPTAATVASAPGPVSAILLFKDYKTNEALADISYKGKRLVVNGVVETVNKHPEVPSVTFSGGGPGKTVQAQFQKIALDKLSTLKRGQNITVTCMGGGMVNGAPILKACMMSAP